MFRVWDSSPLPVAANTLENGYNLFLLGLVLKGLRRKASIFRYLHPETLNRCISEPTLLVAVMQVG